MQNFTTFDNPNTGLIADNNGYPIGVVLNDKTTMFSNVDNHANVIYANASAADGGNGTQTMPFNTVQAAINAASDYYTIRLTGDFTENVVMRDLNAIAIIGDAEINTSITNATAGHTFNWTANALTGFNSQKFTMRDLNLINGDTTGAYHAIHFDGSAIVWSNTIQKNTFLGDECDINFVDIDGSGTATQPTAYFRMVGCVYWTHGQIQGGALSVLNCTNFRTRQLEIGAIDLPMNFYVEYNSAEQTGGGRSDTTLGESSVAWGDVIINGHPIFQVDRTSLIVGNVTGTLTSFYLSPRDYCPELLFYGQHGVVGGSGGNITLTFQNPQASGSSFNFVDLSGAHILGTVSFTKAALTPANTRGYAVVLGKAQFDTTTSHGITVSGYVALDLRGAVYNQSTLYATSGMTEMIDRSIISFTIATPSTTNAIAIPVCPLPTGATYTVSATPPTAVATGVSSKTVAGFNLLLGTGGGTSDVTITRI